MVIAEYKNKLLAFYIIHDLLLLLYVLYSLRNEYPPAKRVVFHFRV